MINFNNIGFTDCRSTNNNEGGALYIHAHTISIQNVCAFLCETELARHQFARIGCEINHTQNIFTQISISSCGPDNKGCAAIGFCEKSNFDVQYLNSSYNYNYPSGNEAIGACYRTGSTITQKVSFFNFIGSTGYDVFNTYFLHATNDDQSNFYYGNVFNCTTEVIFQFIGINTINNVHFGKLTYLPDRSFQAGNSVNNKLTVVNSIFDVRPTFTDTRVTLGAGVTYDTNVRPVSIILHKIDRCLIPTAFFSQSSDFTSSSIFTPSKIFSSSQKFTSSEAFSPSKIFTSSITFSPSKIFTSSSIFSPSEKFAKTSEFTSSPIFSPSKIFTKTSKFTSSVIFSPSEIFTSSITFSPSSVFTPSRVVVVSAPFTPSSFFTPSFTFSPERTKFDDGLSFGRAHINGSSKAGGEASPTAIGITAGISVATIIASVVLMVIYLRSKQKQLAGVDPDFSDSFLNDDDDSSHFDYSYSYYTYTYTYERTRSNEFSYYTYNSDAEYSEFDPSYESFEEENY